jgi:DNA-binding GntR family transcriptional regulator
MTNLAKPTAQRATRERIFVEILRDLEAQRIVPGQRIAEGDLVERFGVSRNAVREGIQLLSERGVLDLSPNKSAVIRRFTWEEAEGVMDLCAMLNGLLARTAARNYPPAQAPLFAARLAEAEMALGKSDLEFARARRHFTLALLDIAQNKELRRVFPMAGIAIFNAQFRSQQINSVQVEVFRRIHVAVTAGNAMAAEKAGRSTIENLRKLIAEFF